MVSFERKDTNQKLVIAMLVQAINHGKKRRALEQQRLAVWELKEEMADAVKKVKSELVDQRRQERLNEEKLLEEKAERASLRMEEEEGPDVWPFFEEWREEVGERERELERIRNIPVPEWNGSTWLEGVNYANADPW